MDVLALLGYFSAVVIGISLGLIGGGGSILTVPVLAYLFAVEETAATAYSLFIVGVSALVGAVKQYFKGHVHWRIALMFGIPSILSVTLVRYYVIPNLPEVLFTKHDFEFTRRMAMFGTFALLMIPMAISMLKSKRYVSNKTKHYNYLLIFAEGIVVGAVTGFIGVGGGFLIIPALVILTDIPMKQAVGTSLMIIALKSLSGFFLGDVFNMAIDWRFIGTITALSLSGIFIGSFLSNFVNGQQLKKGFGYFVFVMAVFIFYMEFVA